VLRCAEQSAVEDTRKSQESSHGSARGLDGGGITPSNG
jgi:hypothetical protein